MTHLLELTSSQIEGILRLTGIDVRLSVGPELSISDLSSPEPGVMVALVSDLAGTTHQVEVRTEAERITAYCSCLGCDEHNGQLCPHAITAISSQASAVAVPRSAVVSHGPVSRTFSTPPSEIASVIEDISLPAPPPGPNENHGLPEVSIALEPSARGLGVQIAFNKEILRPMSADMASKASDRALDTILLQLMEERGRWDERQQAWFVSASRDIRIILGLVTEYRDVVDLKSGSPLAVTRDNVDAVLIFDWSDLGLELSMEWRLPDGSSRPYGYDLVGTGPYWVAIDSLIYPVSESAARIASLFPHGPNIFVPRYQVGPVLEALPPHSPFIRVLESQRQPTTEVHRPQPVLTVSLRSAGADHFSRNEQLELNASLEFDYPAVSPDRNVVYLPDRDFEEAAIKALLQRGFQNRGEGRRFSLIGDDVLDFLHESSKTLPSDWILHGIEEATSQIRFSELSVEIALSEAPEKTSPTSINWFDCQVTLLQNNANVPLSSLFKKPLPDDARWIRLDSGSFAKIPAGSLFQLKSVLGLIDPNFKQTGNIKAKLSTAQALSLSSSYGPSCSVQLDKRLVDLRTQLQQFDSLPRSKPHKRFKGKLRSYQGEGLDWLTFLHGCSLAGILADEMGLGKTVQTLAFLQNVHDQASEAIPPSLIIAPTSVTTNWLYEARRFTPDLRVLMLQGPHRKRLFPSIPSHDLVITSYALLRFDRHELSHYQFSVAVLDEAQNIKNPTAATTKAAKALKTHARLALSGTPTENRPLELWSIMDFLMPGYLGSPEFFKNYVEKPILEGGPGAKVADVLKAKIRPFILRRTKGEVERDLPPKTESVLHVEMTNAQRELYAQILEEVKPKVFDAIEKRGVSGASVSILTALLRLRQVCNHPNSIGALRSIEGFDSGKFNLFKELVLEALESNRKILVFSQFREMLAIMQTWVDELSIPYLYLDGTTKERQSLVDRFNSDPSIRLFLISLKAGGTGLNLTAADTVIIYDPWWNPAVESQAVDRAHRIGQVQTVNVYRLVTEHSVEQRIMELKRKKSQLVDALVNENGASPLNLTRRELELLFESPLTNIAESDSDD